MEGLGYAWQALTTTPAIFVAMGGVAWGILGGALPGISPSITMALLLPFTYALEPMTAIVLLASTYVGAEYGRSEEHTSELQSLMRISYAVLCLKKKKHV